MSLTKHPHRRRNYFVKKEFQFKFILKFCLLLLMGVIIATGILLLFSQGTLTSSFQESKLTIKSTALAILPAVIFTNLITLGLISLASIVVTLLVSHKLAGPMFRFEKETMAIGEGDLTKEITLRKNDQLFEIAGSLNRMTGSLRGKVLDVRSGVENLIELASKQKSPEKIIENLNHLHQKINSSFKL